MPSCKKCRLPLKPEAKFCGHCGAAQTQESSDDWDKKIYREIEAQKGVIIEEEAPEEQPRAEGVVQPPVESERQRPNYYSPPNPNQAVPSPPTPIVPPSQPRQEPIQKPTQTVQVPPTPPQVKPVPAQPATPPPNVPQHQPLPEPQRAPSPPVQAPPAAPQPNPASPPVIPQPQTPPEPAKTPTQPTRAPTVIPQPRPPVPQQVQPSSKEVTVGVIVLKKMRSLGRYDAYAGVVTTQRLILAQISNEKVAAALKKSREQSKVKDKGAYGDQLKGYSSRYLALSPHVALNETPGNVSLYNVGIREFRFEWSTEGSKSQGRREFQLEIQSVAGTYLYNMDEYSEFIATLKQVYGDRVKMPTRAIAQK